MRKRLLLIVFLAVIAPSTAHALLATDDVLSYVAMPIAVSNVCDVRGVQTDQVALLASYMDQANVSQDGFIDVFRYAPVALVFNSGRRPDFVQWVHGEVVQGVTGDVLVTNMERRLATYGNVVPASYRYGYRSAYRSRYRHRYARAYSAVFEPYYVPAAVVTYCDRELLDPFALIDMPIAVANVVDIGVPIGRVGNLVLQLDLGYVSPVQTVEVLRYAPVPLLATGYGQPDFVQFVYDQRVSGVTGYGLVQVIDQQLPVYGVTPQIDLAPPVWVGQNAYVPAVVQNYVAPADPVYVPPPVQTLVASGWAAGRGSFTAPAAPAAASPQVQRLLGEQSGSPVVVSPAQARRELAQSRRAERQAARMGGISPTVAPTAVAPLRREARSRGMAPAGAGVVASRAARAEGGRHAQFAAPGPPARLERGGAHVERRAVAAQPRMTGRGVMQSRAVREPHAAMQPRPEMQPRPVMQRHGRPQVAAPPVMAAPPAQQGHGQGGGPPAAKADEGKKKGKGQ